MKRGFTLVVVAVLISGIAPMAGAIEQERGIKSMERPRGVFDRESHLRQMEDLQQTLAGSTVDLAAALPLEVIVTPAERESVRPDRARQQKMRVGIVKELSVAMGFDRGSMAAGRASMHETFGAMSGESGGRFQWAGVVRSPDAAALRIHFSGFNLPEGAELYVFARNGMAFGPYTGLGPNGTGDFWTNTIAGSEMVLQLRGAASATPSFTIAGLGYMTEEFALARNLAPRPQAANTKPCSFNEDCTVDAACGTENSAVNAARDAVAHMLFASGAYLYICSGGLVADSDTSTNIPYFITANHCISRASEASSLETFFFYESSTCQGCPDPGAANTTGSSIVSGSRTSDYTLLRLSQNAPSGAAFLGWSSTAVANSNNTPLYRLSHPKGAPQAYSEHVVDTSKGTCRSWPRGNWIYSRDILGATEGGSSGSPVVNGAGQLVGQLSGGCGYNVGDVCDTASNATVDGAFAAYYSKVSGFLGAGGTDPDPDPGCTDADGDGFCVSDGDCDDNNNKVYPGANDTKGKQGRDGVDNNCNGIIDG